MPCTTQVLLSLYFCISDEENTSPFTETEMKAGERATDERAMVAAMNPRKKKIFLSRLKHECRDYTSVV